MAITINGTGSITGLTAGGLPDGSVTAADIETSLDLTGKTVTLPSGTGGKILQVVTTPYTGQFSTTAANTYQQVTGLNCSITTSSASSKVFVIVTLGQMSINTDGTASYSVTRDGTRILQGAVDGVRGTCSFKYCCPSSSHSDGTTFTGVDTPGAAGTYVYGLQAVAQGGFTNYINRTLVNSNLTDSYEFRASSHITLMEVA
jgi:hypothetical protein